MSAGIDPRIDPIPVAPAAHYHMGGIVTDLWGRTSLKGLSACGECTSTGAHGANRLASNSLLEAVVYAARIADRLKGNDLPELDDTAKGISPPDLDDATLQTLRARMAAECGVVRDGEGLAALLDWIIEQAEEFPAGLVPRALVVSELIVRSALRREESRGGHFRSDFPDTSDTPKRTFLYKGQAGPVFIDPPTSNA